MFPIHQVREILLKFENLPRHGNVEGTVWLRQLPASAQNTGMIIVSEGWRREKIEEKRSLQSTNGGNKYITLEAYSFMVLVWMLS